MEVRNVFLDGRDINREMVREGHVCVYRKYLRDPTLLEYEQMAREAGLGLCALPEALASAHVGCEPVNRLIQVGSSHCCYRSLSGNRGASP